MSKFNVGDKVRYIGKEHEEMPEYYPKIGTIGTIKDVRELNAWIKWPNGSTSKSDCWCCSLNDIERIVEEITNEEIWEMLKPKMEKNRLTNINVWSGTFSPIYSYNCDDVHNAIAIAYRSGYERAMKGRPFKFGEKKKQGGHWEPVDPENLPKEGTKVRYSRECKEYAKEPGMINVGDIGVFSYGKILGLPGIRFDDGRFWDWISFSNEIDCLDMWVEDDE